MPLSPDFFSPQHQTEADLPKLQHQAKRGFFSNIEIPASAIGFTIFFLSSPNTERINVYVSSSEGGRSINTEPLQMPQVPNKCRFFPRELLTESGNEHNLKLPGIELSSNMLWVFFFLGCRLSAVVDILQPSILSISVSSERKKVC